MEWMETQPRRLARIFAAWLTAAAVAACASTAPSIGTPTAQTPTVARAASANASDRPGADIFGTWTRSQSCEDELAAFEAAGLAKAEAFQWVTSNWVPNPSPRTSAFCEGAVGPIAHSHFFTAAGAFGSRDENGQQVDDGNYSIAAPGVLTFPSHASEFGYSGGVLVGYEVNAGHARFRVQVPTDCAADPACADAYGWALSAFFDGKPWDRD